MTSEYVKKSECQQSVKFLTVQMEKTINEKISELKLHITEVINALPDKFDERYASKKIEARVRDIESEAKSARQLADKRRYDWLRYLIVTAIGVLVGFFMKQF